MSDAERLKQIESEVEEWEKWVALDDDAIEPIPCEIEFKDVRFLLSLVRRQQQMITVARDALEEGRAMLLVHEDAIRQDHGNSNFESTEHHFLKAKEALSNLDEIEKGE